jgi:hypothetical protein
VLETRVDIDRGRRLRAWAADQRFGLIATLAALVLLYVVHALSPRGAGAEGDGFYNWLYARSLAFDHDIEFTNDYKLCGDPWHNGRLRGTTHPDNTFYIGPSLVWAPLLAVARHVPLAATAVSGARAGCFGSYMGFVLGFGPLVGALALYLAYRAARRFARDGAAAAAIVLLGLASPLAAYASVFPSYVHVYSAAAVAAMALTTLRAWERPEAIGRWVAVGGTVALVVLMRSTDVVVGLVPAVAAAVRLWRHWWRLALALALLAAGVVLGALPTLLAYKYLYGTSFAIPQGRYYLQLGHSHPFLLLFAPHGGFFYYLPTAWLSVAGLVLGLRRARPAWPLLAAILGALVVTLWICSAPLDWHANGTFGARRLVAVTVFFVMLAAIALEEVAAWLTARPRATLVIAASLAIFMPVSAVLTAVIAQGRHVITTERAHSQADLYGAAPKALWEMIDANVGPLAILPAALVFRLRYGVPMRSFAAATETYYYNRSLDLVWTERRIPVAAPAFLETTTGMTAAKGGLGLTSRRSSVVFSAQWFHATHLGFTLKADRPTTLKVGAGGWFGTRWYGEVKVEPANKFYELPVPPGGFDSGLRQVVFEVADPAAGVVMSTLGFDDREKYKGPFER